MFLVDELIVVTESPELMETAINLTFYGRYGFGLLYC